MSYPCLLFCPYLPISPDELVAFADWQLGSLESFKDRWADSRFKDQATAFLKKFVDLDDKPIENPALLCRAGKRLDGQEPSDEELRALRLSLVFAYVDRNPRKQPDAEEKQPDAEEGWAIVTADNAEVHAWPIDLEQGRVSLSRGELVEVNVGGYRISDPDLLLRPPLDLHMPFLTPPPDSQVLTAIYETILRSLRSPNEHPPADRIRIAVEWFEKAWLNTRAIQWPERLVYLKTAFEALTGTHSNWKSARRLREIFEALPQTTERDSEILVWSPAEKPVHCRPWVGRNGRPMSRCITDLERWFIAFGEARNTIIHKVGLPEPMFSSSNCAYRGPLIFTAEYLLRAVIKVLLANELGYENVWRSDRWRGIMAWQGEDGPGRL